MKADIVDCSFPSPSRAPRAPEPTPPSPPTRYWRLSLTVSLAVLLLLASLVLAARSLRSHAGSANANVAASKDNPRWSSLGFVDLADGVTLLYPLVPGRVAGIDAKENKLVKAGAALFHLDDTVPALHARQAQSVVIGAEKQLAIAEAKLEQANQHIEAQKTAIAIAQENVNKARLDRDKQKDIQKSGIFEKEKLEAAEATLKQASLAVQAEQQKRKIAEAAQREAEAYVAAMRASVEVKKAQLEEANNAVKECVVRAPVEGTPLRILVAKGQVLGSNPRQPAVEFAAQGPLLVRAEVEQEFVNDVKDEQDVTIEDNVTGEKIADGKVASMAQWYAPRRTTLAPEMAGLNNDVRTLECIIHLAATSRQIRIHQRVRVRFSRSQE